MDNKLVEEVHRVDFRELSWHVQTFDIQRRCIVAVVGIVFSCLEIFHLNHIKRSPCWLGGGAVLGRWIILSWWCVSRINLWWQGFVFARYRRILEQRKAKRSGLLVRMRSIKDIEQLVTWLGSVTVLVIQKRSQNSAKWGSGSEFPADSSLRLLHHLRGSHELIRPYKADSLSAGRQAAWLIESSSFPNTTSTVAGPLQFPR